MNPTLAWQRSIEKELSEIPSINRAALIVYQGEALRDLEKARKHVAATQGKPLPIQKVADDELFDAIALVEEFDALTLEAI